MSDTATETAHIEEIDEEDTCSTCGCWCGGCPCAEDEERAAENGDDEVFYHATAHCCECGRSGPECEYHCTCA